MKGVLSIRTVPELVEGVKRNSYEFIRLERIRGVLPVPELVEGYKKALIPLRAFELSAQSAQNKREKAPFFPSTSSGTDYDKDFCFTFDKLRDRQRNN